jgi:hypothetical protein
MDTPATKPSVPDAAVERKLPAFRTINEVAKEVGVSPQSIRNWERDGLIPIAHRTPGGHRRFSDEHVRAIEKILRGEIVATPKPQTPIPVPPMN